MRLGGARLALAAALALSVVFAVLLSPLGFERRPPAGLTPVGYVSIGAVVAGVLLDLAAIALVFRRVRVAAILALVGSVAFLIPNVTDKAGVFFTVPAPPVIGTLEFVHLGVVVVTLLLASVVLRRSERGLTPQRDA